MLYNYTDILIIDRTLYVSFECLSSLGIPNTTIKDGIQRQSSNWVAIPDPQDARRRLIAYEPLADKYKSLVIGRFGDPYQWLKLQFFADKAIYKTEDAAIIDSYELSYGQRLPLSKRKEYKKSCAFLAFLASIERFNKSNLKKYGFDNSKMFWQAVYQYLKGSDIKLPASARIKNKLKSYKDNGAYAVIHSAYGNAHSRKINDDAIALIVKLMRDTYGRKFSKKEVWHQFRVLSKQNGLGLDNITYVTVCNYIKQTEYLWYAERHGKKEFMLNRSLVINQRRASQPHLQWQVDGTPASLWYYDQQRKTINKLYVVAVMDSHSNAIIGYSIGDTETQNLVFAALKMSVRVHGAKPHELRSDKGSSMTGAETKALLNNLGIRFKPSKAGSARSRTIEAQQGHWMKQVKTYFINKSGANITAKTMDSRQNSDKIKANYKDFPNRAELVKQIQLSIALYNQWEREGKPTRASMLKDDAPDLRTVDAFEIVEYFYVFRKKGKKLRTYYLTTEGLTMQVGKKVYKYLPQSENETALANFINRHCDITKFYIKYDPSDLSQIALYTLPDGMEEVEENLTFLTYASEKGVTAQFMGDATDAEKDLYQYYRKVQQEQAAQVEQQLQEQDGVLDAMGVLAGSIDIKDVRKDEYNRAEEELQRLHALGYHQTMEEEQEQFIHEYSVPNPKQEDEEGDIYDKDFDISDLMNL